MTIPPVFPTHLTPEVQYGNEKADTDNLRTAKVLDTVTVDSTLKPHITQKPEKPLAIYFKNGNAATTEVITRAETINDFTNYEHKQFTTKNVEYGQKDKSQSHTGHLGHPALLDHAADRHVPLEVQEFYGHQPNNDVSFTSGHSKLFGISIEDAEKMKSTTQSSLYNTRVSPTLPTWRDRDDTTTKKYPSNIYSEGKSLTFVSGACGSIINVQGKWCGSTYYSHFNIHFHLIIIYISSIKTQSSILMLYVGVTNSMFHETKLGIICSPVPTSS